MAMKMRVDMVTPELAAHYLKRNVDNYSKINKARAALFAEEMKAGKWPMNGDAIMFDETGRLKNGLHRLVAILVSGIPVEMTIIEGVADDVMFYDTRMKRSTKQMAQASECGGITSTEAAASEADPMIQAMKDRMDALTAEKARLMGEIQKAEERIKCIEDQQEALKQCIEHFEK